MSNNYYKIAKHSQETLRDFKHRRTHKHMDHISPRNRIEKLTKCVLISVSKARANKLYIFRQCTYLHCRYSPRNREEKLTTVGGFSSCFQGSTKLILYFMTIYISIYSLPFFFSFFFFFLFFFFISTNMVLKQISQQIDR